MLHERGDARLVEEHRDELRILGVLRVQPLDREPLGEPARPCEAPQVDRGHAAGRDLTEQRVAPDALECRCGGHRSGILPPYFLAMCRTAPSPSTAA